MESMGHTNWGDSTWHGRARIHPDRPVAAGETGTWTITYTTGRYGVDNGGRLKLGLRLASDWGSPQTDNPKGRDFFSVRTTGNARVEGVVDRRPGYLRPWFKTVTIYVTEGSLAEGDQVIMVMGDSSRGGPGTRAQTFREVGFQFLVLVDCFETGLYVPLPTSPRLDILGSKAEHLRVIAPSEVVVEEPFRAVIKAEDRWGNPSDLYRGTVILEADGFEVPARHVFDSESGGVRSFTGVIHQEGLYRIRAVDSDGSLCGISNPIRCLQTEPEHRAYWADLHGQTRSTVGTGTVEEYFRYARDVARVDVCTHQGNDFQITGEAWREIQENTEAFHEPGRFVTYLGYEWSGNHPAGGDHNVIWFEDGKPIYRSSHWQVPDTCDVETDCYPIDRLHEALRSEKAMVIPHIGGRPANLDYFDPDRCPVIEICSVHGRFEWFLTDALGRGLKVGVVANGDDHTGRPGASRATGGSFGGRGGLTCILARHLSRESIWEALEARRTYATTGERIHLLVHSEDHPMGAEFSTVQKPTIDVEVVGTSPLYAVEIRRGDEMLYSHPIFSPEDFKTDRIRLAWSGARIRGRGRHSVWDGTLSIDGGQFTGVSEFAFDHPEHGVTEWDAGRIAWRSITSGDLDGLLIDVEGPDEARLEFRAEPCAFAFTLGEIRRGAVRHDAGGVERKVEASLAPGRPGPEKIRFSFRDESPRDGINPYYVRVVQEDGEMAWSSPLYIDYRP